MVDDVLKEFYRLLHHEIIRAPSHAEIVSVNACSEHLSLAKRIDLVALANSFREESSFSS